MRTYQYKMERAKLMEKKVDLLNLVLNKMFAYYYTKF